MRYAHTDAHGNVHHARYLLFLEEARTEFLRARGVSPTTLAQHALALVVAALRVNYRGPARVDDELAVRVKLQRARSRSMEFLYRVERREGGRLLIEAASEHLVVNEAGHAVSLPSWILRALQTP